MNKVIHIGLVTASAIIIGGCGPSESELTAKCIGNMSQLQTALDMYKGVRDEKHPTMDDLVKSGDLPHKLTCPCDGAEYRWEYGEYTKVICPNGHKYN